MGPRLLSESDKRQQLGSGVGRAGRGVVGRRNALRKSEIREKIYLFLKSGGRGRSRNSTLWEIRYTRDFVCFWLGGGVVCVCFKVVAKKKDTKEYVAGVSSWSP